MPMSSMLFRPAISSSIARIRGFAAKSSVIGRSSSSLILGDKLRSLQKGGSSAPLVMGCVCYDPSVYDIWGGIQTYLVEEAKVPFDYVCFTNYEAQVHSLLQNRIDVAWNGPIAHVLLEQHAADSATTTGSSVVSLGMRDVDRDFESVLVVPNDANIATAADLDGKHAVTGASDSPQAHVVPLYYLERELGIEFGSVTPMDCDLGKHGDTAVGEIKALEALLLDEEEKNTETQPRVAVLSRMMWDRACSGRLPGIDGNRLRETHSVLESIDLPAFDHCQFDAILSSSPSDDDKRQKLEDFGQALLEMDMDNPDHAHLMKLEGIEKRWETPRQRGYDIVRKAINSSGPRATDFSYNNRGSSGAAASRAFSTTAGVHHLHQEKQPQRVAVIGAGVAGLQAIRALRGRDGIDVTAFEAGPTVGGLWTANYSNFGLQVPKQLYEFQDFPMRNVERGTIPTGPQVQSYIEDYADEFIGLKDDDIRFNTKVTGAKRQNDGSWTLKTEGNKAATAEEHHGFDYLVVATGLFSTLKKFIPSKPNQQLFEDNGGVVVHSSEFCDASAVRDKNVVVVGSGKSAIDCAVEAARAGASSVVHLQRTAHWPVPINIAGLIPFQQIFLSRFGQALVSIAKGPFPEGSGAIVNAFRNSAVGPVLMKPIFRLVEEIFALQFGLRGDLRPRVDIGTDFYRVAMVLNGDWTNLRKEGKIDTRLGEIEAFGEDNGVIVLDDGSSIEADTVVYATGFENDYSFLEDNDDASSNNIDLDVQDDGAYFYRYILPEKVPGLAFIGNVSSISNSSSYGLQAEWLARHLTNELVVVPTPDRVREDIEDRKEWARAFMPFSGSRGTNALLHQTHYHDLLLRDMGLDPHRKSNPFSEYLMPYESSDYDRIMGGGAPVRNKQESSLAQPETQ